MALMAVGSWQKKHQGDIDSETFPWWKAADVAQVRWLTHSEDSHFLQQHFFQVMPGASGNAHHF